MKINIKKFTIFFLFFVQVYQSQITVPLCGTTSGSSTASGTVAGCSGSQLFSQVYNQQSHYVPSLNDPLIGVNVVFHIILPQTTPIDPGRYQPGNGTTPYNSYQELLNLFNDATYGLHHASDRWSVPCTLAYAAQGSLTILSNTNIPGNINNGDSRVYYRLANVYYYYSQLWETTTITASNCQALAAFVEQQNPGCLSEGIPVFACNTSGKPFSTTIIPGTLTARPAVYMGMHAGQDATTHVSYQQSNRITLRHELGHCMGWMHASYPPAGQHESTNCQTDDDFLSDVIFENNLANCQSRPTHTSCTGYAINVNCGTCLECDTYGTNNVMTESGITWDRRWMSPLQMGRRIRSLHINDNAKSSYGLRQYAVEMQSQHTHPWLINNTEEWRFDIQMYRDIVVKSGNTLSITCQVAMAEDGKIIVEKGAKLVINGGKVTGWCKKAPATRNSPLWKGIEIQGDPSSVQVINSNGYCAGHGIVEVLNGGRIENAVVGISTGTTNSAGVLDLNSQGGIVITNNAYFTNNVYDIIFYKYIKGHAKSVLRNSTFQTTGLIGKYANNTVIPPKEHIKLYNNHGLTIEGCTFKNTFDIIKGIGIYTTDSYWYLKGYCATSNCTSPLKNQFTNLEYGVYIDNINPLAGAALKQSNMYGCLYGVMSENCYNLTVSENTLSTKNNGGLYSANQPLIYLFKSKYYKVRNNLIFGDFNNSGLFALHAGIAAYDSKDGAHEIYRNDIQNCFVGILAQDDNGGFQLQNIGLRMHCNIFNSATTTERNFYDIGMTKFLVEPVVMSNQSLLTSGHPKDWVRNLYGAQPNFNYHKWFVVPSQTVISIAHRCGLTTDDNPELVVDLASPQVNVSKDAAPLDEFDHAEHCPGNPSSAGGSGATDSELLDNLNDYITLLRSGGTTTDRYEIQSAVASKLQIFSRDTAEVGRDSVLAILQNNQGGMDDADLLTVFAHLAAEDYTSAQSAANALGTGRQGWQDFFSHLIPLQASDNGVWTLQNDEDEEEYFRDLAGTEGAAGQASAQALLRLVFDESHAYPLVFPPSSFGERRAVTAFQTIGPEESLRVYPNPTETKFTIDFSGDFEGTQYEVFGVQGNIIFSGAITSQKSVIDMTRFANSLYFCRISDASGRTLAEVKLIKQ